MTSNVATVSGSFDVPHGDGRLRVYYAAPEYLQWETPSVVLAMHLWGIDAPMRDAAQRFAAAGFAVAIPDLYSGLDAPDGENANDHTVFVPFAQRLIPEAVDEALRAAAAFLKERAGGTRTAIAGFCMGGTMALRRAYGYADVFRAAAVWYGNVAAVDAAQIDVPVVASFGADDHGIPVERVNEFRDHLQVDHDIAIYPQAGHAFCDAARPTYVAAASEESWKRTIAFLRKHL